MLKARQKTVSLLVACLTMLCAMFFAFVGIFSTPTTTASAADAVAYSYTFTSKQFSANGSKTLGGVTWTLAGDGGYWGNDGTKGQQFGSSGAPYKSLTLTSSTAFNKVSKIEINTSGASSVKASFTVKVGGTQVGGAKSITASATNYTFTPTTPLTGTVAFSYTQTSSKAIYIKSITIYEETTACTHVNTTEEETQKPTCTAVGSKNITCTDCGNVETVTLPMLAHTYVNGLCNGCGAELPASVTLTFNDKSKRTSYSSSQQIWEENGLVFTNDKASSTTSIGDYANPVRLYKNSTITIAFSNIIKIEFNSSTGEYLTALTNSLSGATVSGSIVTVTLDEPQNEFKATLSGGQVRLNSITVYTASPKPAAKIDGANLTVGENLKLNYIATLSEAFADATMYFEFDGKTIDVEGVEQADGRYAFSLEVPPQAMGKNVSAVLMLGDVELDKIEEYSIKQYAINKLNAQDSSAELKQLLTDMLYYGAAAQAYNGETTNLVTEGVENLGTPSSAVPTEEDNVFALVNAEVDEFPVYFKSANVKFGDVNNIRVTLSTYNEKVGLTVNGTAVDLASAVYTTEGILATGFATEYTFVLSYNGEVMQTLTYSVNSYAYKMQNNDTIGTLALALYNYGKSAVAYNK